MEGPVSVMSRPHQQPQPVRPPSRTRMFVSDLSQELKCAVCLDLFQNPRCLECQHTFCTYCLEQLYENENRSAMLLCPLCRKGTFLPTQGVAGLPQNTNLANITEHLRNSLRWYNSNESSSSSVVGSSSTSSVNSTPGRSISPDRAPSLEFPPKGPSVDLSGVPEHLVEKISQQYISPPPDEASGPSLIGTNAAIVHNIHSSLSSLSSSTSPSPSPSPPPGIFLNAAPVEFSRSEAMSRLFEWARSLWFAPNDLQDILSDTDPSLLPLYYIPFYVFEARVTSYYEARVTKSVRASSSSTSSGSINETWTVTGKRQDTHEDLLVCASEEYRSILHVLEGDWNYEKAVPTTLNSLIPETAESWDESWRAANLVSVIEQRETVACENKIRNEERVLDVRDVVARVDVEDVLHTLVYFPVYISSYTYKGESYRFMINAQSGTVRGSRPYGLGRMQSLWSWLPSRS